MLDSNGQMPKRIWYHIMAAYSVQLEQLCKASSLNCNTTVCSITNFTTITNYYNTAILQPLLQYKVHVVPCECSDS